MDQPDELTPAGPPRFTRFGRSHHLRLETVSDLKQALQLDEALWVATSCPLNTLNCDPVFLALLDTDRNGRLQVSEVREALRWTLAVLADPQGLLDKNDALVLNAINLSHPDGQRISAAARKMLDRLEAGDFTRITLAQVRRIKQQVESASVSEAGVVLPEAADDPELHDFLAAIVTATGGAPHPVGQRGVTAALLDQFRTQAEKMLAWRAAGRLPADQLTTAIQPLGDATTAAAAAVRDVAAVLDAYFAQCRAVALDGALLGRITPHAGVLAQLDWTNPQAIEAMLRSAPPAPPRPAQTLPLDPSQLNPAYRTAIAALHQQALIPLLGDIGSELSVGQWRELRAKLSAHEQWRASKPGAALDGYADDALQRWLDPSLAARTAALLERSHDTAFVLDNVRLTEKLVLYQQLLLDLLNNFVSFPDLFQPRRRALFELGTLVMDGRRFNLAVPVENRAEHAAIARTGSMCVLYIELTGPQAAGKREAAVPVTAGGIGNLTVGKRGVFLTLTGELLDARVVQIIDNPISLREAVWAPFKRLGAVITGKIESMTSSAEKQLDTTGAKAFDQMATLNAAPTTPTTAAPATAAAGAPAGAWRPGAGGLLAGGGIAIAALGSATAYIARTVEALTQWHNLVLVILAAVLAVLAPTTLVAWLKLRRRDLSVILEGAGWAINAQMRLTSAQSRYFTQRPPFPAGAQGVWRLRWAHLLWLLLGVGLPALWVMWLLGLGY